MWYTEGLWFGLALIVCLRLDEYLDYKQGLPKKTQKISKFLIESNLHAYVCVVPPGKWAKRYSLHWLLRVDIDGEVQGLVALQWEPSKQLWFTPSTTGYAEPVKTRGWTYVEVIHTPHVKYV